LDDVLSDPELSIGSYRRSVSTIIPEMTRVALRTKHAELVKEHPDFDQKKFVYRLSRAEYEKEWDNQYQKPGWRTRFFAAFVRILPKIGPLKNVDITLPTPTSEDLYIKSVNKTFDSYKAQLMTLRQHRNDIDLPNLDFDTGKPTKSNEYKLADQTCSKLVEKWANRKFDFVTPELQTNLMAFYSNPTHTQPNDMSSDEWRKVESAVSDLKGRGPASK